MKSASGKRPPDEANGPGKEAIRPHRSKLKMLVKNRFEQSTIFENYHYKILHFFGFPKRNGHQKAPRGAMLVKMADFL